MDIPHTPYIPSIPSIRSRASTTIPVASSRGIPRGSRPARGRGDPTRSRGHARTRPGRGLPRHGTPPIVVARRPSSPNPSSPQLERRVKVPPPRVQIPHDEPRDIMKSQKGSSMFASVPSNLRASPIFSDSTKHLVQRAEMHKLRAGSTGIPSTNESSKLMDSSSYPNRLDSHAFLTPACSAFVCAQNYIFIILTCS